MIGKRFRRISFWLVTALFLLACVSPLLNASPTQTPQSLRPQLLGTPVAQTAAAAQTQTIIYLPPSLTPTLTLLPTWTPVVLSSTPTFFFALPTFTPLPTSTSTPGAIIQRPGSGGDSSGSDDVESIFTGKEWTCAIREKSPAMGAVIARGASFYLSLTLFNTGTKTWTNNGVDFRHKSGLRNEGKPIQDLPLTIAPGNQIKLKILFTAPNKPDTYNTVWTMVVGRTSFCGVKYTFEVK